MKIPAALLLLSAYSASADDNMSFSLASFAKSAKSSGSGSSGSKSGKGGYEGMSKSGKGFGNYGPKSGKGSKGTGGSGKSGKSKLKFDDCSFENPILNFYNFGGIGSWNGLSGLGGHGGHSGVGGASGASGPSGPNYNFEDSVGFAMIEQEEGAEGIETFEGVGGEIGLGGSGEAGVGGNSRVGASHASGNYDYLLYILLQHQYFVNEAFAWALDAYFNHGATAQDIWEFGEYILNLHPYWIVYKLKYKCWLFCGILHQLVEQMKGTCNYDDFEEAYANVAALLMSGFMNGDYDHHGHGGHVEELGGGRGGHGHHRPDINVLHCPSFDYYYGGHWHTFEDLFGDLLTSSTVHQVDFGGYCEAPHDDGPDGSPDNARLTEDELAVVDEVVGSMDI